MEYENIVDQILAIRSDSSFKAFQKDLIVSDLIFNDLAKKGKFFANKDDIYYFSNEQKLILIAPDNREIKKIIFDYKINPTENLFKYVLAHIYYSATDSAIQTTVQKFSYFDDDNYILYVYNNAQRIYKIKAGAPQNGNYSDLIEVVDNGTDGVLFVSNPKSEPIELAASSDPSITFENLVIKKMNFSEESILNIEEQKTLYYFWFYSLFFESLMTTKPIILMSGPWGSGKSSALLLVLKLFIGKEAHVTSLAAKEDDFVAAVTNNDFVIFDNVDKVPDWTHERLALCATGGNVPKRKYFTTNEYQDFPIKCFVGLTMTDPYKFRSDLVSRLLHFKLKKLPKYTRENFLEKLIAKNRNELMTDIIVTLQSIVTALKTNKDHEISSEIRMADFASFALKITHLKDPEYERQLEKIFSKLSESQAEYDATQDDIFLLMKLWAEKNKDRFIIPTDLFEELSALSKQLNLKLSIYSSRSFGQKFSKIRKALEGAFEFEERPAGGHRKKYSIKYIGTETDAEEKSAEPENKDYSDPEMEDLAGAQYMEDLDDQDHLNQMDQDQEKKI